MIIGEGQGLQSHQLPVKEVGFEVQGPRSL